MRWQGVVELAAVKAGVVGGVARQYVNTVVKDQLWRSLDRIREMVDRASGGVELKEAQKQVC